MAEYLRSNITMLRWMIDNGYQDARTLERRARAMEEWLANPSLMRADADAEYAEVIEIDMSEIKEPLLACPNDPDDVKPRITSYNVCYTKLLRPPQVAHPEGVLVASRGEEPHWNTGNGLTQPPR